MKLLKFQEPHRDALFKALQSHNVALDTSDTGTGKTYTALAVCKALNKRPLVVAPKVTIPKWNELIKEFNLRPYGCFTDAKLRCGKTGFVAKGKRRHEYVWSVPSELLLIVDEAHRFGGDTTENGYILALTKPYRIPTLILSATLATSPLRMRAVGYLTGLHNFKDFWEWKLRNGCVKGFWGGLEYKGGVEGMQIIHEQLFPEYGSRMRVSEIPDFPEVQINAEICPIDNAKEVTDLYKQVLALAVEADEYKKLHKKETDVKKQALKENKEYQDKGYALTALIKARRASELAKIVSFTEYTENLLAEGHSVVVFFNFRDSLDAFKDRLEAQKIKHAEIHGDQTSAVRQMNVDAFQNDSVRVIVCTFGAGGVGVSLHDLNGTYPRAALLSVTDKAVELKQAFGRIHRAQAKSKALIRILYAEGTVEEGAAVRVNKYLQNIDSLNDGDLAIVTIKETN